MSRIHDALRKAVQERVPIPPAEAVALPEIVSIGDPATKDAAQPPPAPASVELTLEPSTEHLERPNGNVGNVVPQPAAAAGTSKSLLACCAHRNWRPDVSANVFLNPELALQGAERFRTLRLKLYEMRANQSLRTLLVTSAIPGDGKTWVVSNLAQSMIRQPNRRVLLIDADLRGSRLHEVLGAPPAPGLTDYLMGEADESQVIQRGGEGNLYLIAVGSEAKHPAELLANGRMKELLDRVSPEFDWVLLDSPPCLHVADASLLASYCDGVLMVVRAGMTPSELAQKASQELDGKNIVGVVLNGVENSRAYQSSGYNAEGKGRTSNGTGRNLIK